MKINKIIAIYQIISMFIGFYMMNYLLSGIGYTQLYVLMASPFILLFIFVGVAGFLLFKQYRYGKNLSIIAQSLQVCQFSFKGFQYKFGSGIAILFRYDTESEQLRFNFLPIYAEMSWEVKHNLIDSTVILNLVPVLIIFYLITKVKSSQNAYNDDI